MMGLLAIMLDVLRKEYLIQDLANILAITFTQLEPHRTYLRPEEDM